MRAKIERSKTMKFLIKKTPDNFIKSVNDEISSILNRHFNSFYPDYDYANETDSLIIPVEVRDKNNEYDIRAELPGVDKKDLDISLNDGFLTISATKTEEKNEDEKTYKKSEFSYGVFSRTIQLPQEVDTEKIDAKLDNGVLRIVAPKLNKDKEAVKKICVK